MTALVEVHSLEKIKKQYSAFSLFFMCVCVCVFDEAPEFFHPVATEQIKVNVRKPLLR